MTAPDRAAALAALAVSTGAGVIPPAPPSLSPPTPPTDDGSIYAGGDVPVVLTLDGVPLVYTTSAGQRYADPAGKGQTVTVSRSQADRLLGLGWAVTPGEDVEEAAEELEDGGKTDDQLRAMNAAELVGYVVQNPEERERVYAIEQERGDKARKTVLTASAPTPEADLLAAEAALEAAGMADDGNPDDPADPALEQ